ncbi:MAG: Uma2 family endonuclease [Pleurocapsa sp. SU_196_0]|nr:Uma2 family endonuclease [Pleurocapsa sp. SU_196_0]
MNWQEVLNDQSLQDLPYKIELNAKGHIEMHPVTNWHAYWQAEIAALFRQQRHGRGRMFTEASIDTPEGVKVPDVVWASKEFLERYGRGTPFPRAPEICVEIVSPSNTVADMDFRKNLFFEQGAHEVWFCNLEGALRFFDPTGQLERSGLVPDFPVQLEA